MNYMKNKKKHPRYPKQKGSHYGTRPGIYLIDKTGHKVRLNVTCFSTEVLSNHLVLGNIEFQVTETMLSTIKNRRELFYE